MTGSDPILAELRSLAAAELARDLAPDELAGDVELATALDSMQLLSLVVRVEDHFRVIIEEDDEARIVTVDDLVAVIRDKRSGPG